MTCRSGSGTFHSLFIFILLTCVVSRRRLPTIDDRPSLPYLNEPDNDKAHKHLLSLIGTELADVDVPAGPKWKGKGRASDMDVFN